MAILYTDQASLGRLEVTGSTAMSGSSNVLHIKGSGSAILVVSGSIGGIMEIGDITNTSTDIYVIESASIGIFKIDRSKNVSISGSLTITGSFTSSLRSGHTFVGGPNNISLEVATSSFGGGVANTVALDASTASLNIFTASADVSFANIEVFTSSANTKFATIGTQSGSWGAPAAANPNSYIKGISIYDPTSAEDITIMYTSASMTIQGVQAVLRGTAGQSVTITLRSNVDRSAAGTAIVSAQAVTSITTAANVTLTANTSVAANTFIWLETTAIAGTVNELYVQIEYA